MDGTHVARASRAGLTERTPPEAYFVGSAIFHYLGPAFAVLLFARVDPLGVAWLRIASAAAVFALWRRPWQRLADLDGAGRRLLLALGAVFAVMNACFYVAIDRLPLGTVAAIEFLPVIALAALGARTSRNVFALVLAVAGVYLLVDVELEGEPVGVAFAFANAALFAAYIVLAHRLSRIPGVNRLDGLAAAMMVAAVVATPLAGWNAAPALLDPVALAAGIGVGLSSSVVPYVLDQLAMARLSASNVLAHGLDPPCDRDGRRHRRAQPGPDLDRGRRRRVRRPRGRAPPRVKVMAPRCPRGRSGPRRGRRRHRAASRPRR